MSNIGVNFNSGIDPAKLANTQSSQIKSDGKEDIEVFTASKPVNTLAAGRPPEQTPKTSQNTEAARPALNENSFDKAAKQKEVLAALERDMEKYKEGCNSNKLEGEYKLNQKYLQEELAGFAG